tara:strand:- start:4666 stop:4998 length:333 start_codon:yes stop_codon:yes gene_type:complete
MSRYTGRRKAKNDAEMYENVLDDRGTKQIVQYTTVELRYPSQEDLRRIRTKDHVWRRGDKFWRIAARNYGDPKLWWVVAQFNQKPTEHHVAPGEIIKIPIDLAPALGALS